MIKKTRTRNEIVDKMEELYKYGREGNLPLEYVIPITDALDWCLGDSNYLDTEQLQYNFIKQAKENTTNE